MRFGGEVVVRDSCGAPLRIALEEGVVTLQGAAVSWQRLEVDLAVLDAALEHLR